MDSETAMFLPDALVVNVPKLDEQHAELFARLAHLKNLCVEENYLPASEGASLFDFLCTHCATEEAMAMRAGLDFAAHAEKHRAMLKGISKALRDIQSGKTDAFSVLRYIDYWFERHISEEDIMFGARLQQTRYRDFAPRPPESLPPMPVECRAH